jgi:cysteine desulfurase/selenocysteine lyase
MDAERVALGDKSSFPELTADAYLSYAAIAPASARVARAVSDVLASYAKRGQVAFPEWAAQRERLRGKLAAFLNAEPNELALVTGTTCGIADIALCMPWKRGDGVVLLEGEFPANITPWQRASELFGLRLLWLKKPDPRGDEAELLAALASTLKEGVRLVAVSAVEFQTGLRLPIAKMAALCHAHGAELCVDAIQACGVLPLDMKALEVDYLVGGAHKWLMGMEGAGFVYAKAERGAALEPRTAGWLSHEDGLRFLVQGPGELRYDRPIKRGIQFVEGGSSSAMSFAAMEAGLDPLIELGPARIFPHVTAYLDELEKGLLERDVFSHRARERERQSGILTITPPDGLRAMDVVSALRKRGVFATQPEGLVRFAPHFPNALDEVPRVLAAFDASVAELRGAG